MNKSINNKNELREMISDAQYTANNGIIRAKNGLYTFHNEYDKHMYIILTETMITDLRDLDENLFDMNFETACKYWNGYIVNAMRSLDNIGRLLK